MHPRTRSDCCSEADQLRGCVAAFEPWRSRIDGERWLLDEGHLDYLSLRGDENRRTRCMSRACRCEV
jgi:hypothetical protein